MIFRALALRQIKGQGANALTKGARKINFRNPLQRKDFCCTRSDDENK